MRRRPKYGDRYLDDPFTLDSRSSMPTRITEAFDYCLRLWLDVPLYRAACDWIVSHFLTRIMFRGEIGSHEEREKFETFFIEKLGGLTSLRRVGLEHFCYGNGFLRCHMPFNRILVDRRRNIRTYSLSAFPEEHVTFDLQRMVYMVPDPQSDKPWGQRGKVAMTFRDMPSKDFSQIRFRTLNPRYVRLRFSEASGQRQVEYLFEPETKSRVTRGVLYEVNRTPKDMLIAMARNGSYLFNPGAVFHMVEEPVSGISNEGWGLPLILSYFPALHRIMVLQKANESICKNHLLPYRVVSPNLEGMGTMESQAMATEWIPAAQKLFKEQAEDPSAIHAFPYPLIHQTLGGEGKAFVPTELLELETANFFRALGVPLGLYEGSLNMQQAPMAMRMFENAYMPLSRGLGDCLNWMVDKTSSFMYGEAYDAILKKPSVADDFERRSLLFNLYAARDIPARVAFENLDLERPVDLKVEAHKEQLDAERRLATLHKEDELQAQMGSIDDALNAADAEQAEQQQPAVTPLDMRNDAEQLAQQWLAIPHDGERAKAMQEVKAMNPDLYAVAKDIMEQIRSQGASEGRQMAAEQFRQ